MGHPAAIDFINIALNVVEEFTDGDRNAQFLFNLSDQRVTRVFAKFDLSARQFPPEMSLR